MNIPLRLLLAAVAAVSLLSAAPVIAQQRPLSLEEAIDIAVANNREIDLSQFDTRKADAAVQQAFGNALPSISANASYTRNLKKQIFYFPGADGITRPIEIGSANAVTADLRVQQILFNAAVLTGMGTAESYAKISREQLRSTAGQTVLAVRRAYYSALLARDVLRLNEAVLKSAEQNYSIARQYFEQGLRAEFDAIRADVQVSNQRPAVVQAQDNYALAIESLKLLLGFGPEEDMTLTESLVAPASLDTVGLNLAGAQQLLEENNPQLRTARLGSDVTKDLIDINKAEYLPTLAFIGSYQLQAQADNLGDLSFQPTALVGLNLSVNLFNGYQTTAKVEQATIDYEKSRTQVAQLDNALRLQLQSVLRKLNYARLRIASSQQTIAQAERGYQIATVAYRAGTGTQYQINDADLARSQSQLNQINAIYDYRVALAELEALIGRNVALTGDGHDVVFNR